MTFLFVNYRRADAAGHAGRLYDHLTSRFRKDHVFMDLASIGGGADFVRLIQETLRGCDVLLAVIGRSWLQELLSEARRPDDKPDWVRLEILTAFDLNIRVIPILVQGAELPTARDLPQELHPMTTRNAYSLPDDKWDLHLRELTKELKTIQSVKEPRSASGQVGKRGAHYPLLGRRAPPGALWPPSQDVDDLTGADATELIAATELPGADELATQLNKASRRRHLWPLGLLMSIGLISLLAASNNANIRLTACILLVGLAATTWLALQDRTRRSVALLYQLDAPMRWSDTPLDIRQRFVTAVSVQSAGGARVPRSDENFYKLDASQAQWFQDLTVAWEQLTQTSTLWRIAASRDVHDRNDPADESYELVAATAGFSAPTVLRTDAKIPAVAAGDHSFYFLADRLLLYDGACFAEMSYAALRADWQSMHLIETGRIPDGAIRVRYTWDKVTLKGEQYVRAKFNTRRPVMSYGRIELTSETGLRWILLSSQTQVAERVVEALRQVAEPGAIASVRAVGEPKRGRSPRDRN
jgi:hypothetical protein